MVVKSESPAVENFNPNLAISSWLVNKFLFLHKLVILKLKLSVFYNMNKLLINRLHHQGEAGDFIRVKKDCRNAVEKQQKQIVEREREQDETAREHEREGIVEEQKRAKKNRREMVLRQIRGKTRKGETPRGRKRRRVI